MAVGDTLTVRLPRRTGPYSFALETMDLEVTGFNGNPVRSVTYMSVNDAALLGLDGLANVVSIVPADGVEIGDLQADFLTIGQVTSVQRADAMAELMEDLMSQFVGVFQVFEIVVLVDPGPLGRRVIDGLSRWLTDGGAALVVAGNVVNLLGERRNRRSSAGVT